MGCTALTVAGGELTIALGWAKTMVSEPDGHGLALLEVAGTCAVIWILAHNQREKELVEGSLRQSERRFRALVQHASDIILVVASDGTVSYASPAFESVLGYSSLESVGMVINTIMDDEDATRLARIDEQTQPGTEARSEMPLRHHDGSWRWFEFTFSKPVQTIRALKDGSRTCVISQNVSSPKRRCAKRKKCSATRSTKPVSA